MSGLGFSVDGSATDAEPRQLVLSSFRKRRLRVDWRAIATLDLERLVRDTDFQSLQENVMNVAFCDIEREDFSIDSNFLKLFKLAQLIIEYVLYCQKRLQRQAENSRKQADDLRKAESELTQQVATLQKDLAAVKRENKKRRKMLEAAQSLMTAGANGYHRCSMCAKAFVSDAFLQSHMQRRHGEQISLTLADGMMQQHSDRLKQAVEAARQEAMETARAQYQIELQNGLRGMQEKMETVTQEFRSEISRMEKAATQGREADLAEWRRAEEERRQKELSGLEQKIQLLESEKADALKEISDLRSQQLKRSNLGDLEDDDEAESHRRSQLQQQEQLLLEQREQHQHEIGQVRAEFADELRKQERKWKKQLRDIEAKHHLELEQASNRMAVVERELQESQRQSIEDHMNEDAPDGRHSRQSTKQAELVSEVAVMMKAETLGSRHQLPHTDSPPLTATGKETRSVPDTKTLTQGKPVTKAQPLSDASETEDSDDDLDISSYKGSVSHEIAASIQRSRQNGQAARQTMKVQQKSLGIHKEEEALLENGRQSSEEENEVDSKVPGKFTPFESHPEIKTQYNHSAMTLESHREKVLDLLDEELKQKGISVDSERLSVPQFKDKMAALEKEREVLSKKHRNVFEIRRKKESEIDKIVRRSYKPGLIEAAAAKPPRTPKQPQGLQSSGTSNQHSVRPPAPTPGKASMVPPSQLLPGNDESDDETGSVTETVTETPTLSTSPEQQRAANRPMATLPTDVSAVRSKPAVPQPYTSTPAQSGTSLADGVQLVKRGSNFTDGSENAVISKIPSHPSSQKQEISWDSDGSSLSETEKDEPEKDEPHIVKLFSGQPSSTTSTQQGIMSGRPSTRRGTDEVQMRRESSTPKKGTGKVASLANRLSASLSLSPDPSKRPKGGVALFGGPAVDRGAAGMLDDDDDFDSVTDMDDFSESKEIGSIQPATRDVNSRSPVKVPSSAVSAFNQRDDLSDLDDDLETTTLQH